MFKSVFSFLGLSEYAVSSPSFWLLYWNSCFTLPVTVGQNNQSWSLSLELEMKSQAETSCSMQAMGTVALQHFTASLVQPGLALTACCCLRTAEVFLVIGVRMKCGVSLKSAQPFLYPVHCAAAGEHQGYPVCSCSFLLMSCLPDSQWDGCLVMRYIR